MASPADKPVIVIKKKGGHHGHHGGAWKIAYADFVTAMMAFFLCMWLVNTADQAVKAAIAKYFKRPGVFESGSGTPLEMGGAGILPDAFAPRDREEDDEEGTVTKPKKSMFEDIKEEQTPDGQVGGKTRDGISKQTSGGNPYLEKRFKTVGSPEAPVSGMVQRLKDSLLGLRLTRSLGNVLIKLESRTLRIELTDLAEGGIFYIGSAQLKPEAMPLVAEIADFLKTIPNRFAISGHTDSTPKGKGNYTNWELSTDRANSFRKALAERDVDLSRLTGVIGYADRQPLDPSRPASPENRRVALEIELTDKDLGLTEEFESIEADSSKQDKPTESATQEEPSLTPEQAAILKLQEGWRIFDPFE